MCCWIRTESSLDFFHSSLKIILREKLLASYYLKNFNEETTNMLKVNIKQSYHSLPQILQKWFKIQHEWSGFENSIFILKHILYFGFSDVNWICNVTSPISSAKKPSHILSSAGRKVWCKSHAMEYLSLPPGVFQKAEVSTCDIPTAKRSTIIDDSSTTVKSSNHKHSTISSSHWK